MVVVIVKGCVRVCVCVWHRVPRWRTTKVSEHFGARPARQDIATHLNKQRNENQAQFYNNSLQISGRNTFINHLGSLDETMRRPAAVWRVDERLVKV